MAFGPAEGLALVDALVAADLLDDYHHLHAVRGELLEQLGRLAEAHAAFARAATLTTNTREQAVLTQRAARLAPAVPRRPAP